MSFRCAGLLLRKGIESSLSTKSAKNIRQISSTQNLNKFLVDSPNTSLDKSILDRYKNLDLPKDKVQVTYLWIDGTGEHIRLKDRVVNFVPQQADQLPKWQYDGSSTYQALGENSDCTLIPRALYKDPFKPGKNDGVMRYNQITIFLNCFIHYLFCCI